MAVSADDQGLPLSSRHDPFPRCLGAAPWPVDVRQLADVVGLKVRLLRATQLALPGQQALHDLGAPCPGSEPGLVESEVNDAHPARNPLERDPAEHGSQRLLAGALDEDPKRLAAKDGHLVLPIDFGY